MALASVEKLEHTGPAEKERVASVPQRKAVDEYAGAAFAKREKEQSRLSRVPEHEEEEG